jgi:diguanylate cyclase (GGDEF)-like protein
MVRAYTMLFSFGALLGLLSLAVPGAPARSEVGIVVPVLLALGLSALIALGGRRLPRIAFEVIPSLGTVLIAVGAYSSGAGATGAYVMLLFWVVLAAGYFCPPRVAALHTGVAIVAAVLVLTLREDNPLPALYAILTVGTLAVGGALVTVLRREDERRVSELQSEALTDPLTGLANRRALEERFDAELQRAARGGQPLSVIALDLDNFKLLNDRRGHETGDAALTRAGAVLREAPREIDVVARLGGDEFAVLLPDTDAEAAYAVAERLRIGVGAAFSAWEDELTMSAGVAAFPDHGATSRDLLRAADSALYHAKEQGRDRSVALPAVGDRVGQLEARTHLLILLAMAEEVEQRKGGTANNWRAGLYAEVLALELGLSEQSAQRLRLAARLRDVGGIGVPEEVFRSTTPLSDDDLAELHKHCEIGARMIAAARLADESLWVLDHHERPDGKGYPHGLAGSQIPLEARILAVVDAYTAMQSRRHYRPPLASERAREELRRMAGRQFDREVVDAFLSVGAGLDR